MRAVVSPDPGSYPYASMGYANPDAVTQIANGLSTSTFSYDNNGNLAQKTTDGVITTYAYDYANRLIALGSQGATTTYGYDAFGSRVFQSTGTTTSLYPFKWYSVASSTGTGAKYATTTEYVFNGDSLVSTADQQTASGVATGTAQTRFIHPDHLGSTNVVTNASGTVVQTLDYYPYGATRISASVGGADSTRKYIDQFADNSGLDYFNARYYSSDRGQFTTEEPIFLALGDAGQVSQLSLRSQQTYLTDPQQLNSFSYGRDNPITNKDANGKLVELVSRPIQGPFGIVGAHTFVAIIPDSPKTIGTISGVNTARPFTLGGYTTGVGDLFKATNSDLDYSYAYGILHNNSGAAQVVVTPPPGVSSEQFDSQAVASYNALPNTISDSYGLMGQKRLTGNPNSNNTATSILLGAGVTTAQVNSYQGTLYASNFRITPGLGTSAFAPTYAQGLGATLSSLKGALTKLLGVINGKK
jgi:RHS repeat-associated protein